MDPNVLHSPNYRSFEGLISQIQPEMPPQILHRAVDEATHLAAEALSTDPTSTTSAAPTDTIAPYATNLNGVNQTLNYLNRDILWWTVGILCMLVLVTRVYHYAYHQFRLLSSLSGSDSTQKYWSINATAWYPKLKKHLIYAPLFRQRHNREKSVKVSKWNIGFGTVPSRAHTIMLAVWIVGNCICCAWLNYSQPNYFAKLAELRGRSGFLAVANLLVMVILAARNNPLLRLLQLSFDDMNLFHRWIGRLIVLESLVHTFAWGIVKFNVDRSFDGIETAFRDDPFITWGLVSMVFMLVIAITSVSSLRHAFYETFLHSHIIMAVIVFVGVYLHCKISKLPQLAWMQWAFALWGAERFLRVVYIVYPNFRLAFWQSWGAPDAEVEALAGTEACRVTIHLPKSITINPGSHAYIRIKGINIWQCHPFSIAWTTERPVNSDGSRSSRALPITTTAHKEKDTPRSTPKSPTRTSVSFIISAHTGFTRQLYNKAITSPANKFHTKGLIEGPYGGLHSLDSYGTTLLIAGATGITHQLLYVKHLVQAYSSGLIATKRIVLIWIIRDVPSLEWIRTYMDEILRYKDRREVLTIKIFVTRPTKPNAVMSPSQTVQMFPGRPNLQAVIEEEVDKRVGAMCVSVCGPGSMCDSVRHAVRGVQHVGVVDLLEESFTW